MTASPAEPPDRPALDATGVDWVQPRVCEDTFDNRRLLREAGYRWRTVPPEPGSATPSGLIEVPDPAVDQALELAKRADFMVNPRDPWSDYVDLRELPLDASGVPYPVMRRLEKWREWESKEAAPTISAGVGVGAPPDRLPARQKLHPGKEPFLPVRCKAVKANGMRCWLWSMDAELNGICHRHAPGAALDLNQGWNIMLARLRAVQAAPAMMDNLEELALGSASEQVRLKATTEVLDRAGVSASTDLNVNITQTGPSPAVEVRSRLDALAARLAAKAALEAGEPEPLDAEVIEGEVIDG